MGVDLRVLQMRVLRLDKGWEGNIFFCSIIFCVHFTIPSFSVNIHVRYTLSCARNGWPAIITSVIYTRTQSRRKDGDMASSRGKRRKGGHKDPPVSGVKRQKDEHGDVAAAAASDSEERFTFFFGAESPFSQWHSATFTVAGVKYNCAEQYMMHQKACRYTSLPTRSWWVVPRQRTTSIRTYTNYTCGLTGLPAAT